MEQSAGAGAGQDSNGISRRSSNAQLQQEITFRIQKLFFQLTAGCGYRKCKNPHCASNPDATVLTANEAAAAALKLATDDADHFCVPSLQSTTVADMVNKNKSESDIIALALEVFSSPESLNRSFVEADIVVQSWRNIVTSTSDIPKDSPLLQAFAESHGLTNNDAMSGIEHTGTSDTLMQHQMEDLTIGVETSAIDECYRLLFSLNHMFGNSLVDALESWATAVHNMVTEHSIYEVLENHSNFLTQFVIVLKNPQLMEPEYHTSVIKTISRFLSEVPEDAQHVLIAHWATYDTSELEHLVRIFQHFITLQLLQEVANDESYCPNDDEVLCAAVVCLGLIYQANEISVDSPIPITEFYNDAVNEHMDLRVDFPNWKTKDGFSFIDHPFILDPAMKSEVLRAENSVQMRSEMQDAFFRSLFAGPHDPYLILRIRREHLIRDALTQLNSKPAGDLKKMLRVQFAGEDGVDEGGVRKEFFQLVVREIFDTKYGMFLYDKDFRTFWFNVGAVNLHMNNEFYLIGLVLGLAIYNSIILDVRFPMVVYKKLLGAPVSLEDLKRSHPELGKGLQQLLDFDGDVQNVYDRTFVVEYESFGCLQTAELKPGGANIPLTKANRSEYVRLYVDWMLNVSIEELFREFKRGFDKVAAGSALKLFRPEEVELLVCGSPDLDFAALRQNTVYDGGFAEHSPVIKYFWEVVDEFTDEQKKQLLFFATGSDRVPIGGLARLQFIIAKNGPDSDRLPTAHTCFNVLLLSDYANKEKLRERLLTAIANSEGFGMI